MAVAFVIIGIVLELAPSGGNFSRLGLGPGVIFDLQILIVL